MIIEAMEWQVTAVIFDMDGVITNTMPDHFRAWRHVLAQEGIHVNHFDIYKREGQRGITSLEEIFHDYGKPLSETQSFEILRRKEELFKANVKPKLIPGARKLLFDLKRRGFTLALVTGTSKHELLRILPNDLLNLFKVVVTGDQVKNGKPAPDPYLLSLSRLELTAQKAIVIENAPYGVQAAKAAGLACLGLATSLPKEYLKEADYVFSSIKDMRERIHLSLL